MCWMEIEYFRGIPIVERKMKDNKARMIRKQFFNRQYFFGPQSPANKQQQLQVRINNLLGCVQRLKFNLRSFLSKIDRSFKGLVFY